MRLAWGTIYQSGLLQNTYAVEVAAELVLPWPVHLEFFAVRRLFPEMNLFRMHLRHYSRLHPSTMRRLWRQYNNGPNIQNFAGGIHYGLLVNKPFNWDIITNLPSGTFPNWAVSEGFFASMSALPRRCIFFIFALWFWNHTWTTLTLRPVSLAKASRTYLRREMISFIANNFLGTSINIDVCP